MQSSRAQNQPPRYLVCYKFPCPVDQNTEQVVTLFSPMLRTFSTRPLFKSKEPTTSPMRHRRKPSSARHTNLKKKAAVSK